jgi:hypothetical protein
MFKGIPPPRRRISQRSLQEKRAPDGGRLTSKAFDLNKTKKNAPVFYAGALLLVRPSSRSLASLQSCRQQPEPPVGALVAQSL